MAVLIGDLAEGHWHVGRLSGAANALPSIADGDEARAATPNAGAAGAHGSALGSWQWCVARSGGRRRLSLRERPDQGRGFEGVGPDRVLELLERGRGRQV